MMVIVTLPSAALPVSQQCYRKIVNPPVRKNQQSIFGGDSVARGVRFCPVWVAALPTCTRAVLLGASPEDPRGATLAKTAAAARFILTVSGEKYNDGTMEIVMSYLKALS
jgi:hypothetical protein